jgi:hypothetical protein
MARVNLLHSMTAHTASSEEMADPHARRASQPNKNFVII